VTSLKKHKLHEQLQEQKHSFSLRREAEERLKKQAQRKQREEQKRKEAVKRTYFQEAKSKGQVTPRESGRVPTRRETAEDGKEQV
jgi:hypothetical protein